MLRFDNVNHNFNTDNIKEKFQRFVMDLTNIVFVHVYGVALKSELVLAMSRLLEVANPLVVAHLFKHQINSIEVDLMKTIGFNK